MTQQGIVWVAFFQQINFCSVKEKEKKIFRAWQKRNKLLPRRNSKAQPANVEKMAGKQVQVVSSAVSRKRDAKLIKSPANFCARFSGW